MNRSILIVICDFLLVSLLTFSSMDMSKVSDEGKPPQANVELATNVMVDSGKDLTAVMRLALDEERKGRDKLLGELERTKATAAEREKQAQATQEALQSTEKTSQRVQQERAQLQQQYASAQTSLQNLTKELQTTAADASLSKQKLAEMEAGIRKQTDDSAALRARMAMLEQSNQVAHAEQQRLANQLQVAEVERRNAAQQAARMEEEVKAQRQEKMQLAQQNEKLAEGVKNLASNSGELAKEVRENRPLAPNTIFNDFNTNRVEARFVATRSGLLGESSKRKETQTILVSDGKSIYALCHVQDTPVTLWTPGTDWEGLSGNLVRNGASVPIRSIYFHLRDPRIVWTPLLPDEARTLGGRVYRVSTDPYKFQDAVLVGTREAYYGECRFQIDPATPDYVRLDNSFLKGLLGKFNPSRGDLVFSKTGELLGVMANGSYCMMLKSFEASATFRFGQDVRSQHTGQILSQLYSMVAELPPRLQ